MDIKEIRFLEIGFKPTSTRAIQKGIGEQTACKLETSQKKKDSISKEIRTISAINCYIYK